MKKTLLACCMMIVTSLAWAQDKLPGNPAVVPSTKGEVLEVTDVDNFTYLLLKTPNGETWAAVRKAPVKKGDTVTVENATVMTNFESKTLKKSFPTILFGSLAGASGGAAADHSMAAAHAGAAKPEIDLANISVPKASGPNARTVAEINTQSAALKDKPVVVAGKVVKFNPDIMGKNWVHLRDGTGTEADKTNDILVTTKAEVKAGDIVTFSGTVRTDKDFGSGYIYKVMVEDGKTTP